MEDKARFYGRYFDYVEYMWSLKDDPNMLVIFYEDLIMVRVLYAWILLLGCPHAIYINYRFTAV